MAEYRVFTSDQAEYRVFTSDQADRSQRRRHARNFKWKHGSGPCLKCLKRLELTNFRDWILAGMFWIKEGPSGPEMHFNLPMYAQFRGITEDQAEIEIAKICREVLHSRGSRYRNFKCRTE